MPILFPWQPIHGELYWDGGVMANSPLFIALERKVEEIIVVLLSPVGHRPLPPPTTLREGLERVFEHFLIGSYQTTMPVFNGQPAGVMNGGQHGPPAQKHPEQSATQDFGGRADPDARFYIPAQFLYPAGKPADPCRLSQRPSPTGKKGG
jgi:predicted acylesterase/phospholipase RssA